MIQLATFELPAQQEEANNFLRTQKPAGPINFNQDRVFVFFDDGSYPAEYEIADLSELVQSQKNARIQLEIARQVLEFQRADVNYQRNKAKYDELTAGLKQVDDQLAIQDMKTQFVQDKIDALRATT